MNYMDSYATRFEDTGCTPIEILINDDSAVENSRTMEPRCSTAKTMQYRIPARAALDIPADPVDTDWSRGVQEEGQRAAQILRYLADAQSYTSSYFTQLYDPVRQINSEEDKKNESMKQMSRQHAEDLMKMIKSIQSVVQSSTTFFGNLSEKPDELIHNQEETRQQDVHRPSMDHNMAGCDNSTSSIGTENVRKTRARGTVDVVGELPPARRRKLGKGGSGRPKDARVGADLPNSFVRSSYSF